MAVLFIFYFFTFLNVGTPSGVHLFGNLPWPIFESSIFTHYIIQFFKFLQILVDLCGQLSYQPYARALTARAINSNLSPEKTLPRRDSNPPPPWYQASTLPIELPCLGGCSVHINVAKWVCPKSRLHSPVVKSRPKSGQNFWISDTVSLVFEWRSKSRLSV